MSLFAQFLGHLKVHCSATPVLIGSPGGTFGGRRSMWVAGRFAVSSARCGLVGAQPFVVALIRLASARVQQLSAPSVVRFAQALSRHPRHVTVAVIRNFEHQRCTVKTALSSSPCSNPALNLAPFGRWTLRDKPAQRRLALR